jgi:hypothetical protein
VRVSTLGPVRPPEEHLDAFVDAFVVREKKDRWKTLLARRGAKGIAESHKLRDALDGRFCTRVAHGDVATLGPADRACVFFDFWSDPEATTAKAALARGPDTDAIASLDPGRLAVYFFHEGEVWLCRRFDAGR